MGNRNGAGQGTRQDSGMRRAGRRQGQGTPTAAGQLEGERGQTGRRPGGARDRTRERARGGQDGRLKPLPSLLLDTRGWGADRKTPRLFTAMAPGTPRLGLRRACHWPSCPIWGYPPLNEIQTPGSETLAAGRTETRAA